jgi:hypothetical protein
MIDLKDEIYELLSTIPGVKVQEEYPKTPPKLPLITFNEIGNVPLTSADDREYLSRIDFQVDIWTKSTADGSVERTELGLKVNEILTNNVYQRQMAYDLTDPVSGFYRKLMRFEKIA